MRRLALVIAGSLSLEGQAAAAASGDRWNLIREVDPITDQSNVRITLPAESVSGARGGTMALAFSCAGPRPGFVVAWPAGLYRGRVTDDGSARITWRFDSQSPRSEDWYVNMGRNVSFAANPFEMLAAALEAQRLVVRATSYGGDEITATFALDGLRDAMEPLRSACNWTPPPPPAPPPAVAAPRPPEPRPIVGNPNSVENTMRRLLDAQRAAKEARPSANSPSPAPAAPVTAVEGGGELLTASEIRAVSEKIGRCWALDAISPSLASIQVELKVEVDAQGVVRVVRPAGSVPTDPQARAVFEAARRALFDPACSPLPIPPGKLAAINRATFRFNPRGMTR